MNIIITRYSSTLLPLAVAVLGILQAAQSAGKATLLDWQTLTQIALLLAGTGVVYWLPLVNSRWQGALKTGAAIVFAVVSALVAVAPDGHFTKSNLILVVTAVVKAIATELGVQIRTDAAKVIDAGSTADPAVRSITSVQELSTTTVPEVEELSDTTIPEDDVENVGGDEAEQPGTADDPKHLATT